MHAGLSRIEGTDARYRWTDKGYNSYSLIDSAQLTEMTPVIPPCKSHKSLRRYGKYLYRLRYLIENAFLELKLWRGIATQYAKNTASFLVSVHVRCIAIWAKIKWRTIYNTVPIAGRLSEKERMTARLARALADLPGEFLESTKQRGHL